ncbi:MAG: NAD(P)-binding domain-containing protein [Proteobacteria bacterium]|nr:NAD(P)-binding domain-containing protein [Pseudomonadota bacterium]
MAGARLGFLGTGTIAQAVVRGLAGQGARILVSRRSEAVSAALAAELPEVTVADNQAVVDGSDVIFIALLPGVVAEVLPSLRFRPDQQVISFAAGLSLSDLAPLIAPARAAALMLPFPGIARGGSPVLAQGDVALVERFFGARNRIFPVETEAQMDALLCAQAVLSPALRLVEEAGQWLDGKGVTGGEDFLRLLVGSTLTGQDCGKALTALDTPGGYNQRLRQHMDAAGMAEALQDGLDRLAR